MKNLTSGSSNPEEPNPNIHIAKVSKSPLVLVVGRKSKELAYIREIQGVKNPAKREGVDKSTD